MIKVDVEGSEWAVAAGMAPILKNCRHDLELVVEIDPDFLRSQGKGAADIFEIFCEAGFHSYSLEPEWQDLPYLASNHTRRPIRIRKPVQCETNVIFSRQKAEVI